MQSHSQLYGLTVTNTHAAKKNNLTSVKWQVINFMMENQNTRDKNGERERESERQRGE